MLFKSVLLLLATDAILCHYALSKTFYHKINQAPEFSIFASVLQNSDTATRSLLRSEITIFIPENHAFDAYNGIYFKDLLLYHIAKGAKTLEALGDTYYVKTLKKELPPLWITKVDNDFYVNNAKILLEKSNYLAKNYEYGNEYRQVLHVIDRVLDPINFYNFSPTAYDVISRSLQWRDYSTTYFAQKVNQLHLKSLFNESGRNTYFVPLDAGFDDHRSKMLDKYTIQGHIVRNQVLFTRPTQKNQLYETTADGDYIQILLSFVEQHGKLHVKSYTVLGDSTHPKGDLVAEVVLGNIPVENGVVHLISRPLAVFDRTLKPMPFLPMMSKVEGDLRLNYSYWIGQESGFNEILRNENRSLTYFVPSDFAWRNFWLRGWERNETDLEVLKRHLVIGQKAYTMEELLNLSSEANSSEITLKTLSGLINLSVVKEDGEYYVVWLKAKIPVFRKDYICTNGVVHIINFPFFPTTYYKVNDKDSFNFWAFLKNVVGTVNS